jgi:hypothetical protein
MTLFGLVIVIVVVLALVFVFSRRRGGRHL